MSSISLSSGFTNTLFFMNDFNTHVKTLRILFLALLLGQVLFLAITFLIRYIHGILLEAADLTQIFLIISLIGCTISHILSYQISKSKLQKIDHSIGLEQKMEQYRSILIIKLALLEGASFFTIICFQLTGDFIFSGIAALMIILFAAKTPTKDKIIFELELSTEEQRSIA